MAKRQKRQRQFKPITLAEAIAADKRRPGDVVVVALASQPGGAGYKPGGRFWRRRRTETVLTVQ